MPIKRIIFVSVTVLFFVQAFAYAQAVTEDQIRLTTPGAPWTISIDGRNLDLRDVKVKPDEKSAYFLMHNEESGLNVSIFIEPVDKCKTSIECRDFVLNLGNPAWGKYQDLVNADIGDFSYFEFYRPEVQGRPVKMLDMYAQYVANGYWVDLHISKVLYKKEDHLLFENLIKKLKFVPKTEKPSANSESLVLAQKAGEKWLAVWEAGKCNESFKLLSPISRKAIEEKQWVEYCGTVNKALGKLKSRNLIAVSLTKSLPSAPEFSGATVRYQSTFENEGPLIEFLSFVLEKDGTWTVANYLAQ